MFMNTDLTNRRSGMFMVSLKSSDGYLVVAYLMINITATARAVAIFMVITASLLSVLTFSETGALT